MTTDERRTIYAGKRVQVFATNWWAIHVMDRLYSSGQRGARARAKAYRGLAGNPTTGRIDYVGKRRGEHIFVEILVNDKHVARLYQHSNENEHTITRYIMDWALQTKLRGTALEEQRKWTRGGWIRIEEVDEFADPPMLNDVQVASSGGLF
jgi:hypothetical protein